MRRMLLASAAGTLLAGPTILAFFAGGYFDVPRLRAAIVAWVLVAVAALCARRPLPTTRAGLAALLGLASLTAWTAASFWWAPLSAPATDSLIRSLLHLGATVAAVGLLRERTA